MINFFSFGIGAATVVVLKVITDRLRGRRAHCENCENCSCVAAWLGWIDCKRHSDWIIRPRHCGLYKEKNNAKDFE